MKYAIADTQSDLGRLSTSKRRPYANRLKRGADIFLALLLLPVLLPIISILWLAVRLEGGPGFFIQPRVGRNGVKFNCWKLRTMAIDAEARLKKICEENAEIAKEWNEKQKLDKDPRITRMGTMLRSTSLDELPQIFNVLRGDMSFVGPRPFMLDQEQLYRQAGGRAYFDLRPGITGNWQIEGRNTTSFTDRIVFDNRYHQEISLKRDLGLILKTATVVVKRTGR
ncbi:sugar transferase [Thioclava kandeliae]|uniref:Sugar transferase n=1 Tax=Thioclava kandeliae TaxID=3070818 RepID=A0ABV1SMJ0_9RHOB